MLLSFFTILISSILPDQENAQFENVLHGPRIIPNIIQKKLNKFISKFTIKLLPKDYASLIKNQQTHQNIQPKTVKENPLLAPNLNLNRKNTDFVFYSTFTVLSLSVIVLFCILIRQITNTNKKKNHVNVIQK